MPSKANHTKKELSEKEITDALHGKYAGNARYRLANAFIFKRDWETDFFVQKQNGYCYEFEVKISRSDFLADAKKLTKHQILQHGRYIDKVRQVNPQSTSRDNTWIEEEKEVQHTRRPNKFYYIVPAGMVQVHEVPKYAGLCTYGNNGIIVLKEAPFIHKEKLDLRPILCDKFYHYWLNTKYELRIKEMELEGLEENIERLQKKISQLKAGIPNHS